MCHPTQTALTAASHTFSVHSSRRTLRNQHLCSGPGCLRLRSLLLRLCNGVEQLHHAPSRRPQQRLLNCVRLRVLPTPARRTLNDELSSKLPRACRLQVALFFWEIMTPSCTAVVMADHWRHLSMQYRAVAAAPRDSGMTTASHLLPKQACLPINRFGCLLLPLTLLHALAALHRIRRHRFDLDTQLCDMLAQANMILHGLRTVEATILLHQATNESTPTRWLRQCHQWRPVPPWRKPLQLLRPSPLFGKVRLAPWPLRRCHLCIHCRCWQLAACMGAHVL